MNVLKPLVGVVFGAAVRSTFAAVLVGVPTVVVCVWVGWQGGATAALIAGLGATAICLGFGATLVLKRAILAGVAHGLERLQLGTKSAGLLFERLLDVHEEEQHGERGVALAKRAERLPLVEAEARCQKAVSGLIKAQAQGGGISGACRRMLERRSLETVASLTLAKFRTEDQERGGVDLIAVRDALAEKADELALDMVRSTMFRISAMFALLAVVAALLFSFIVADAGKRWTAEAEAPEPAAQAGEPQKAPVTQP